MAPTFAAALRDVRAKSQAARIAAAERLGQAEAAELGQAVSALCAVSDDAQAIVRAAGIRALGELGTQHRGALAAEDQVIGALSKRLADSSSQVREVATIALGQVGGALCHRALEQALDSTHPEVRFQAIAGYVETSDSAEPRKVIAFLRDQDAEVRSQAARALSALATTAPGAKTAVISSLKSALEDSHARTRAEAALALAKLGDASGRDALGVALDDTTLRGEALDAIAALSLKSYSDVIARLARNVFTSPFDRTAMARTLARLQDARGLELLRAALAGFRAAPRVLAVQAIGELGLVELAPEVIKLVDRARGVDALTLIEALGALAGAGSQAAREGLERLAGARGRAAELATTELNRRVGAQSQPPSP